MRRTRPSRRVSLPISLDLVFYLYLDTIFHTALLLLSAPPPHFFLVKVVSLYNRHALHPNPRYGDV